MTIDLGMLVVSIVGVAITTALGILAWQFKRMVTDLDELKLRSVGMESKLSEIILLRDIVKNDHDSIVVLEQRQEHFEDEIRRNWNVLKEIRNSLNSSH